MNEDELMWSFELISKMSTEEAQRWKPLVLGCWEQLRSRLRAGVKIEENCRRLALASAALALRQMKLMCGEEYSTVKVGEISFSEHLGGQEELIDTVHDLLDTQGVCLRGVSADC